MRRTTTRPARACTSRFNDDDRLHEGAHRSGVDASGRSPAPVAMRCRTQRHRGGLAQDVAVRPLDPRSEGRRASSSLGSAPRRHTGNTAAASPHLLCRLRSGGYLESSIAFSESSDAGVVNPEDIRLHAHALYATSFSRPPPQYVQEVRLEADFSQDHVDGGEPEASFTMQDIHRARLALRRNQTAGEGELEANMIQNTGSQEWHWTVVFTHRIRNSKEPSPILTDPICNTSEVSLLPKKPSPVQFKFLRPVASQVASAKLWSRTCFHVLERYGTACSRSRLGCRRAHSCAEFVTMVRLVLHKRMEWMLPTAMAQVDCASVIDSCFGADPQGRWHRRTCAKHGARP